MLLEIWIVGNDRRTMISNQRQINQSGSMRAVCLLSEDALNKAVSQVTDPANDFGDPSLLIVDYDIARKDDFQLIHHIRKYDILSGIPLLMSVFERTDEVNEECYENGALLVVHRVFSKSEVLRIENLAWQHENTKQFERNLQKQLVELQNAREIFSLNQQLKSRNKLLHKAFGRYFSDDLMELILKDEKNLSLGGEKKNVTIMLTDLRNFTSLSEKIDSDRLTAALNFYFTEMVDIVTRYGGTVIEFMGDGMLAVFGAPLAIDGQVDNAIAASIEMQNAMPSINTHFVENGFLAMEMGIGLHYGEAFVGNIGSEKVMRYNVIGNTVNECSRIESCSVGGQILVSKEIISHAASPLSVKEGVEITVKGLQKPIWIHELTGIDGDFNIHLNLPVDGNEELVSVNKTLMLHLHLIRGKLIDDAYIPTRLMKISSKKILIRIDKNESSGLEVFSNVKVLPPDDKEDLFEGFYAKIIGHKGFLWTLHYTDSANLIDRFIEYVNSE